MTAIDQRLAAALPAGALYAVGGRVRDELRAAIERRAIEHKDCDYVVVGIEREELRRRLELLGRVDEVGAAFAVFKLTLDGHTYDIALPRRERSTGVGHRDFDVQSGPEVPLADDLARRDFRMNMIARAIPNGHLVDPYGGEADIRARRISMLRPQAFDEDPLRILRAAQFAARFSYEIEAQTLHAMSQAAPFLQTVSPERVHDELVKLLERSQRPSLGLHILARVGALPLLLPELIEGDGVDQNEWHAYDVLQHNLATVDATPTGDVTLRLAALFHDIGKPRTKDGPHFYRHEHVGADIACEIMRRLRFPAAQTQTVEHLVRQHMYSQDPSLSDAAIRRFVRRIGPEHLARQFALRHADIIGSGLPKRDDSNERFEQRVWEEVQRKPAFSVRDLAVGGSDVIASLVTRGDAPSGFRGDRRVGETLAYLFEQVTEHPERNERETLLALLEQHLNGHSS